MASVPRYIPANEVRRVLTWPLVNEAVEEALKAAAQTQPDPEHPDQPFARQPPRSLTPAAQGSELLLTMPGYVANYQLAGSGAGGGSKRSTLACKLVTSFSENQRRRPPLPNILAHILLFSPQTGQLQCIMDATQITAWRTAAASIVATKHLFFRRGSGQQQQQPEPSAITVAIVGCGVQGTSHALGMCASFAVDAIHVWNRTTAKAEALAEQLRAAAAAAGGRTRVSVAQTPAAAVAEADVICVATYSAEALVTHAMLKKQGGVHINTVGAGEVHFGEVAQDVYDKGRVYVDSWEGARRELKDLRAEIVAEVGEVIRTRKYPEPGAGTITIFQSMGIAAEDATVAQAVYDALTKPAEVA